MHAVVGSRYVVQFALGESAIFFPLTKPLSKRDFYFFYSTMAVKETVIFIYSMSFWHKVEVNTENMFEFKTLMNKTVPYYLHPFIIQRWSGLHLFHWTPIADTISPDYSDVLENWTSFGSIYITPIDHDPSSALQNEEREGMSKNMSCLS